MRWLLHPRAAWIAWERRRLQAEMDRLEPFVGRIVRHGQSGTIGVCIAVGMARRPWRVLRVPCMQVVACGDCAQRILAGCGPLAVSLAAMVAIANGHALPIAASEVTLAPAADAEAWLAKLGKGGGE